MPETLVIGDETLTTDEAQKRFAQAMAAPEPEEPLSAPGPERKAPKKPAEGKPEHSKPRVSASSPGTAPKRPGRPAKPAAAPAPHDYTPELEGLLQLGYGALAATGNLSDAGAVKIHGPGMARAWNAVAQENAYVRKGVEWLTKGGVWGAVVVSTMPFALQIMANHEQVPVEKVAALGVKDPAVLAKEAEADIIEMARMAEMAEAA